MDADVTLRYKRSRHVCTFEMFTSFVGAQIMLKFTAKQLDKLPATGSMSAVARALRVPVPTVRRWILDQDAPAMVSKIDSNNKYAIKKDRLIAWLKKMGRVKADKLPKAA